MAWQSIPYADYHAEFEGGREQGGRTLEPLPIDPPPHVAAMVRDAPNVTAPVTYVELATGEIDREAARPAQGARDVHARPRAARRPARGLPRRGRRGRDRAPRASAPRRRRGRARDRRLRARPATRQGVPARPDARPGRRARRRAATACGSPSPPAPQLGSMSEAWWCPAARSRATRSTASRCSG